MSNRLVRRASAAVFRKEVKQQVISYLIASEDVAFLDLEMPLLSRAIASLNDDAEARICIACRASLAEKPPGAYLLATPAVPAPSAVSTAAFCVGCLSLPTDELEAHAARVLTKLTGGRGHFIDPWPPAQWYISANPSEEGTANGRTCNI
jgi:hypothetical protein